MTVAVYASGSQAATVTTEHFLTSGSQAGVYTLHVDTNVLQAGDYLELRVYQMVLTGGTARVAYLATYQDAQPVDEYIKISVPISNELTDAQALRFSLKQTLGTTRTFPWKVLLHT